MPKLNVRPGRAAGAALATLCLSPAAAGAAPQPAPPPVTSVVPAPAVAFAATTRPAPGAKPKRARLVRFIERRLAVAGNARVVVRGVARHSPMTVRLRTAKHGKVIARHRVAKGKRFRLAARAPAGKRLWVSARSTDGLRFQDRAVGTVQRLRGAVASWYGPGLFGNRTACGQTLTASLKGVAHKQLRCGTKVKLHFGGRTTTARVVDRGPFHGNREFDLTQATARAIGFGGVGRVWVSR